MLARESLVHSFLSRHTSMNTAMRAFAEELGLTSAEYDPHGFGGYEWRVIWAAAVKAGHRFTKVTRTADGTGWHVPAA